MPKQIRFNAFQMNTVSHQSPGLWTHPRDTGHRYTDPAHWVELAQLLEKGRFDAIFLADVLGVYDVYEGGMDAALCHGVQVPLNDPLALVPLMAHATRHLRFGVTAALTYEHPYTFARRISTLDHLSGGRIGRNIVTGYLDSAARNLGLDRQLGHDERYDLADEYLDVVYKLWEKSWDEDAVVNDKVRGVYTKHADYASHVSIEAALALLSGWTGVDFSAVPLDATIGYIDTEAGRSALASLSAADPTRVWTVRGAAQFIGLGGRGPVLVGDPRQVADQLQAWMRETDIDGFNLAFAVAPDSMRDVVELIVPELQARGLYPTSYIGGTLRHQLFGAGARLPLNHAGRQIRIDPAPPPAPILKEAHAA
jgi:alkanesulfonate monooxygenase SsuD/methylene tetrahydromethanopterin reductase-like flavin-dependent oxidoreductase (luciferase family)